MRSLVSVMLAFACLAPLSANAQSSNASLTGVQGTVSVNGARAKARPLTAGDQVSARKKSRAVIQYADGCRVTVRAGETVIVENSPPCRAAVVINEPPPAPGTAAVGEGAGFGGAGLAVGGAVVLGGVGAVILLGRSRSHSP